MATKKVINGKEYDLHGTDWMAEINRANSTGDYKLAAQFEQARNEKINSPDYTGDQAATNNYGGWLDNTDYGIIGKDQMSSGASWQDVLGTYNNRLNKASGTIGMEKFVNDDIQQEMMDYITANMNKTTAPTYTYDYDSRPTYESGYQTRIDEMLNQIMNREDFSYNAENDPLYQQYKAQYNREGTRAMNDTLAAAASDAGGMNSYAITAAQQANNYYGAQLGDKIPELYQLAYEMYLQDIDNQVRDLGLLQQMDDTQYGRYRDTMSDWQNDRDFAYDMYRDDMGDYQWNTEFDFKVDQADKEWEYTEGRDEIEDGRYDQEWGSKEKDAAWNRAMEIINSGTMPTPEQLKAAGLTEDQATSMLALVKAGYNMDLYGNPNGYVPTGGGDDDTGGDNPGGNDKPAGGTGYDNGGLTQSQVAKMQRYFGVTADGKWGPASQASVGGLSADEAWQRYEEEALANGGSPKTGDDVDPWGEVLGLGIGPVSASFVTEISGYGGIKENGDGTLSWANGWNAQNYQEKLSQARANPFLSYLNR